MVSFVAAALGFGYWRHHRGVASSTVSSLPAPAPASMPVAERVAVDASPPSAIPEPRPAAPTTARPSTPSAPKKDVAAIARAGLRGVAVTIKGPLEAALVEKVGRETALPLAQVVVRALVWWVRVPAELWRGDKLTVLYREEGTEPRVEALRYQSTKQGQTFAAYRFGDPGHSHLYLGDGTQLEKRLVDSPLAEYDEITSLLSDGRGHQGIDFRTAVGSAVRAPFDATVERTNWKTGVNGQSVELREAAAPRRTAIFLHLSHVDAKLGTRVKKGETIAASGNTGHSFAPHLHYQLMSASGKVLDPFEILPTARPSLAASQMAAFRTEKSRLDQLLDAAE